jgi:AcrR family transcriptional regulator
MTTTPWGDAIELRARRLRPGPGADREAVARNQRERLLAGMVVAIAENGYEGTRVADVVKASRVSRSAFYRHFEDKPECFLATFDEIVDLARAEIVRHGDPQLPWDRRLRAMADAFLDLILEQPAAARLCLVEAYAAGPRGVERVDAVLAQVERAMARAFAQSPERSGMPRDVIRAIVGGLRKTIHTRLRRGDEADLIEELPQLIDWALAYHAPSEPPRRPRRRPTRGAAPSADRSSPRGRLVVSVTETIACHGYHGATIVEIATAASTSLSTFYANFDNKEEALLVALGDVRAHALAATAAAYEAADGPDAVRAGIDALFGYLAAEPAAASVALVDAFSAGPDGLEAADQTIWALQPYFSPERGAPPLDPLVSEAVGNAVYSIAYALERDGRIERLRELTPTAAFVALAPFEGSRAAIAVANA